MSAAKPHVLLLTNIPAPYREPLHGMLAALPAFSYQVVYCARKEQNRLWQLPAQQYPHQYLQARQLQWFGREIYAGSNVLPLLNTAKPDVLIVFGFSLPMLQAYWWAWRHRVKLIAFSDGTAESEQPLSWLHRLLRRIVYPRCAAFIGACQKTLQLFASYGAKPHQLFQSCLCIDNEQFARKQPVLARHYDVLLCGQLIPRKMFDFALQVIALANQQRQREGLPALKVLLVGDGPDRTRLLAQAAELGVSANNGLQYVGFVQPADLPAQYGQSKVLLFPSRQEPWGVVANEACAAGTVVITTPNTGCAGELVVHQQSGLVLPADIAQWAQALDQLLRQPAHLTQLSQAAVLQVQAHNYQQAAAGIIDAIKSVSPS